MKAIKQRLIQLAQIIEGWYKVIIGKEEYYEISRKSICSICDINVKGVCSKELGGCGCVLEAKIKCKHCKCPLNKW